MGDRRVASDTIAHFPVTMFADQRALKLGYFVLWFCLVLFLVFHHGFLRVLSVSLLGKVTQSNHWNIEGRSIDKNCLDYNGGGNRTALESRRLELRNHLYRNFSAGLNCIVFYYRTISGPR